MTEKFPPQGDQQTAADRVHEGFTGALIALSIMTILVGIIEGATRFLPFGAVGLVIGLLLARRINLAKGLHWTGRRR